MQRILLIIIAAGLLGTGSLAWYHFARQNLFWELRDELGLAAEEEGMIAVRTEGQVAGRSLEEVKKAAASFNGFARRKMGVHLQRPVELFVSGDEVSYRQVLEREFDMDGREAAKVAAISGGWSGGSSRITAINASAGVMSTYGDRYSTIGHELFHHLQHELSGGKDVDEQALFWLEEGTADFVGANLSESLGGKPLWKWQLDIKASLLRAETMVKPESLLHCNFEQRKALMDRDLHSYQVADLMTWHLLERFPREKRLALIADYFHALSNSGSGEDAFRRAFGLELGEFLEEFQPWWENFQTQAAVFHFERGKDLSWEKAAAIEAEFAASQDWLAYALGSKLRGEYRVFLSGSASEMAGALANFTELPSDKARNLADSSLCVENGGLLVINGAHLADESQRAFSLGILVMRTYEGQMLGEAKEKGWAWLLHGAAYLAGLQRQAAVSGYEVNDYLRAARETVRGRNLPRIETLQGEAEYKMAVEKYGEKEIAAVTELAVYELVREYGWESFGNYLRETTKLKDGRKAYGKVYGR